MNYNVNELLAQANAVKLPITTAAVSGGYSFGIVCSASNGKRISFSKALSKALALEDKVYIAPVPAEGVVLVSSQPITDKPMEGRLNKDERKICYRTEIVHTLIELFRIDMGEHVSVTFTDITIEHSGEIPFAVIKLSEPVSETDEAGEAV